MLCWFCHIILWKYVAQSSPALCDPMDYSLPGSFVHGILQARILMWVAIPFSRECSWSPVLRADSLLSELQVQVSRVQSFSCAWLCKLMDWNMPGFPVHCQFPELPQTHVWVSDAIQPSLPLSSPSPTFNLSQHQGLFKWVSSSHQVAKVLELQLQLQHQSFQ